MLSLVALEQDDNFLISLEVRTLDKNAKRLQKIENRRIVDEKKKYISSELKF